MRWNPSQCYLDSQEHESKWLGTWRKTKYYCSAKGTWQSNDSIILIDWCIAQPSSEKLSTVVCWNKYRDPQQNNMQRMRHLETVCPKWDTSINSFLSQFRKSYLRAGRKVVRARGMNNTKETEPSKHRRTEAHMSLQLLWNIHRACTAVS